MARRRKKGLSALGGKLSPQLKDRLARRSERQAEEYFAPAIKTARRSVKRAKRAKRREVRSVSGATDALVGAIGAAMGDLKQAGLKGSYLRDARAELASRKVDAVQGEGLLKREVRQEGREAVADARTEVAGLKVDRAQKAASTFAQLLKEARTASASEARREETEKAERQVDNAERKEEFKSALREVARLLLIKVPANAKEWALFEEQVRKAEGVGISAARRAVQRIRTQGLIDPETGQLKAGPVPTSKTRY